MARQPQSATPPAGNPIPVRAHAINFFRRDGGGTTTIHRAESQAPAGPAVQEQAHLPIAGVR